MQFAEEEALPIFHWDHNTFYKEGKPLSLFLSKKEKDTEGVILTLPAMPSHTLYWQPWIEKADHLQKQGKFLLWQFDFGKETLKKGAIFEGACKQAVQTFTQTIWPLFASVSLGAILFEGEAKEVWNPLDLSPFFSLLETLRSLASFLPENLPPFLLWDLQHLSSGIDQVYFLNKEHFEYFVLGLKGSLFRYPAFSWERGQANLGSIENPFWKRPPFETLGVLLPKPLCLDKSWELFFFELQKQRVPFRLLYESYATEEWDGLDIIYAKKEGLSIKANRIIQGFEAAGGKVVFW